MVAPLLLRENEVCAQVCAASEAPMGCLGQPSFETGYAPGMRQPHSSLNIWIQLEHGQDLAGINLKQWYASKKYASRYALRYALNLKLPWAAWGSHPLKLDMRRVCASHIPRWSWIQLVIWYALGMRQVCADCLPEIEKVSLTCMCSQSRYDLDVCSIKIPMRRV